MFLGIDKLLERVSKFGLVSGLDNREIKNPEGAGFDLRVGKISSFIESTGFLGIEERNTLKSEVILDIDIDGSKVFTIEPRSYYLITTIEKINMPSDLVGIIRPRGTLFRSGMILMTGQINPGYKGEQTFGIYNASDHKFDLQLGARVAHVLFNRVDGESNPYRGQWNNGRISTKERELQV